MIDLMPFWQQIAMHLWQTTWVVLAIFAIARLAVRSSARVLQALYTLALIKIFVPDAFLAGLLPQTLPSVEGPAYQILAPIYAPTPLTEPFPSFDAASLGWFLTVGWAIGAAFLLLRLRRQVRVTQTAQRESLPVTDESVIAICIERAIPPGSVREAGAACRISGPVTVGFLRPTILLPTTARSSSLPPPVRYTREELTAVLLHEDGHRRRRDPLRRLLARILEALLFFYPPVSYVFRRIEETNELLCDRAALSRGIDPESYLSALSVSVRAALHPHSVLFAEMRSSFSVLCRWDRIRHPGRYQSMSKASSLFLAAFLCVAGGAFVAQSFRVQPVNAASNSGSQLSEDATAPFDVPPVLDTAHAEPANYPEEEKKLGITGTVLASVFIADDGTVSEVTIKQGIESHAAFEKEVLRVVKLWHFTPAQKEGRAVACQVVIPVKFELDRDESGKRAS